MLSRWYALFLGILLLILGVAALAAPTAIGIAIGTLITTGIVWLITAMLALWYGFGMRSTLNLRWFAGIVGALYLIWGVLALLTASAQASPIWLTVGLVLLLLGALGVAAALTPITWLRETETRPGTT